MSYSYNQANEILRSESIHSTELQRPITPGWAEERLRQDQPSLVLTGTSHNTLDWEKLFITTARAMTVPSIAVLDFWSNYMTRFSSAGGRLDCLPDVVAVMDERARGEMMTAGIPAERILVTGQPAFECLAQRLSWFNSEERERIRESVGVGQSDLLVMFASQPIRQLYGGEESPDYLGYTEDSVLRYLIRSLEALQHECSERITLLIRPHPREEVQQYSGYASSMIKIVASTTGDRHNCALAADLVTGMTSVLLVEACYLQRPVISFQPGLKKADILPTNAWGVSTLVVDYQSMTPTLKLFLLDRNPTGENSARPTGLNVNLGSARRIVNWIYQHTIGASPAVQI
ncbi:MAG TPA: hypothetical protein VJP02_13910 [Candidatus Sulfotelmatobacter sp.]|nr:hypothetical protein [Candidatus Sulfotelmatobacter sp.]